MSTLLHIDSSPLESSISRELTREFAKTWQAAHPDGHVIRRDLAAEPPKPIDTNWIYAAATPAETRLSSQNDVLASSDELIGELKRADQYVIGVAMHNFSIPSVLKLWIDQIVRNGGTFTIGQDGRQGLLQGKKATIIVASGGVYQPGTPAAAFDFVEPYLKTVFAFIGLTDLTFVRAGGTKQLMSGAIDRDTLLKPAREHVRLVAA